MRFYIVLLTVLSLPACGESPSETVPESLPKPPIASVSLAPNGATLALNDSLRVQVTSNTVGETSWTWSSGSPALASVTPLGWVRGLAVGDAAIIACAQHHTGLCGVVTVLVR